MRQRPVIRHPAGFSALALLCCATVAAVAGGCDSRQLLAPTTRTVAPPSQDGLRPPTIIGTASVSSEQTGGVPAGPVQKSTWMVVQVSGQYNASPNPACGSAPPNWPCILNPPASSFYAPAPFTSGPVQAWVASGGTSAVPLRGTGGAANTAGQAVGLYYAPAAGTLMIRSAVENYITPNPNPGAQVSSWIISGSYTATATKISNPLTFGGGPTGTPDGTVTFTVGTTAPLLFINPNGVPATSPPGDVDWYIVPGDAVPLTYERASPAYQIFACYRKTTCTYTPPPNLNGRMQVAAYVEGQLVIGRSDFVRRSVCTVESASGCGIDPRPELTVRCDPPHPIRGTDVTCTASVTQNAAFEIVEQRGSGDGFRNVETLGKSYGPGGVHTWSGPAVAATKVRFTAVIHGPTERQETKETTFDVTARTWADFRISVPSGTDQRYTLIPYKMTPYPLPGTLLGGMGPTGLNPASMHHIVVPTGPDKDLWYLADRPNLTASGAVLHLHPALYPTHCDGNKACLKWEPDQNGSGGGTCTGAELPRLRAEIERHEGLTGADSSHIGVGNYLLQRDKPQQDLERFYRWHTDSDRFQSAVYKVYSDYIRGPFDVEQDSFDNRDYPRIWGQFSCTFDFTLSDN